MKEIYFYTRYGVNLGGVGKILNEILTSIKLVDSKIYLILEKELCFNNALIKHIPKNINFECVKDQKKYEDNKLIKLSQNILEKKDKNFLFKVSYLLFRIIDRMSNQIFIEKFFKEKKIDTLIDFDASLTSKINKIKAKKKIIWLHADPYKMKKKQIRNLDEYDQIVTISNEMRENLLKIRPELEKKVIRIYNPVDFDKIQTQALKIEGLSQKEKEMVEKNYTISVMRLETKQKDFETLINAFKILKQRKKEICHYILSDGPDKEKVEKMIEKNNLSDEIKLIGKKQNPYPWMKKAKYIIHSSKYEGLPTVLIESLGLNLPIISTSCPTGPREILRNGEEGILCEVGNYKALAEGIEKLSEDYNYVNNIKIKNKIWKKEFSKEKSIKQIEKLIY